MCPSAKDTFPGMWPFGKDTLVRIPIRAGQEGAGPPRTQAFGLGLRETALQA